METPGTRMAGQSTDKGCVSNVTSAGTSSGDHEQLTKSGKEASHCESIDVDIGEDINKVFKQCMVLHLVMFQAS